MKEQHAEGLRSTEVRDREGPEKRRREEAPGPGSRRKIRREEMEALRKGKALRKDLVYVGRAKQNVEGEMVKSVWANPSR